MPDICETRSRIMAEARKRFARSGFYGTSMDSIVKGPFLKPYWKKNSRKYSSVSFQVPKQK
ncbi:MAG: hypothetical protein XE12_1279 [Synergistales bacterium 54_9]|nr:MAG: hypothetical protein XE12_1279 [Synergistales bacterium 54_9]